MIWSAARPVTSAMRSNCLVKLPAPAVADRNSTIRSPISASGMVARTQSQPGQLSRVSKPRIWPRRADRMALTFADRLRRTDDLHNMDRLQQHRLALRQRFAHAGPRRRTEREIGGIDAVVGAVRQRDVDVDDGKPSGPRATVDHALFDRADIVARYRTADDLFVEFKAGAARHWLDIQHHVAELAMATGLLLVPAALGNRFADRFQIADRGWLRFDVDAEAVLEALECDAQMHLALPHSTVSGALVLDHRQRRVFLVEPEQGLAEFHVVLAVGRQATSQHRRRRFDFQQRRWRSLAARQRIAGLDRIELAEGYGIAGLGRWTLAVMRQLTARMPDTRPASPEEDCSVAPSSRWPASTRVSDSLPPCKCTVLST